jgi:undecaprenyl-phosphate 4-deoxy-4-formamido-L-arabinose transferase
MTGTVDAVGASRREKAVGADGRQARPGLSFVIPVYRSEESLVELHRRIVEVFCRSTDDLEIIFVEDSGPDESWATIRRVAERDPRVRGFRMSRNFGQHNALLCGIREARGDIIVTLDDDLQHPPEEVPKLLAKLAEGHDVVYGAPERQQHGLLRDLASLITKLALENSMGAANARQVSALRVFRARLRDAFSDYRSPTVNIDVLLTWATTRFAAIKVRHEPRRFGASGYTPRKLVRHALNMMTGFSTRPLQLASLMGFVFALFGLAILAYVLIRWLLQGSAVPGFAFLASIIAIFSGAQLVALGIIGEYLARMHLRTMERPPYLVADRTI